MLLYTHLTDEETESQLRELLEWEQRIRMCIPPSDFGGPALPLGPLTQAHCAEGWGCTAIGSLSSMWDPRDAGGEVHGAAALPGPQEDPCLGGTNQTVLASLEPGSPAPSALVPQGPCRVGSHITGGEILLPGSFPAPSGQPEAAGYLASTPFTTTLWLGS